MTRWPADVAQNACAETRAVVAERLLVHEELQSCLVGCGTDTAVGMAAKERLDA